MANKGNSEKTTQIPSGSETENQPDSCTGPNREVDGEKGSKPEGKEGPSGDSLPKKAPNEDDGPSGDSLPEKAPNKDDEETGTLSCQLSDAMPQRTDPRSDPGHDTKEKSESSSEPEETQTEKTTQIPSGSETENQPDSCTGPNREVDGEKGSKPEGKEGPSGDSLPKKAPNEDDGPSGDSLPEKAPNKDDEETGTLSCQLSDAMPQRTDPRSDPGHDTKEKSESSSEPEETQTEKTTQIPSGSETENQPDSCTGPNREVDGEKGSKPERKEGPSGDSLPEKAPNEDDGPSGDSLPEKAPNKDDEETGTLSCQLSDAMPQRTDPRSDPGHDTKEKSESSSEPEETQTEKTTQIPSGSETENQPDSCTGPNREVDGEKGSKPERKEGPSGDSLPEKAPNEDDGPSGDSLPEKAPNKDDEETGTLSCQLSDAMPQRTDPRSDPGHDTKEKSESSSEPEETQTEKTTQIPSGSETENQPDSCTGPNREVDGEKGSKPERKEGPSGDSLPEKAPNEDDGPSGDSLPEKAPNKDDEETGTLSCQLSDAMPQRTDPRSDPGHDTKEKSESSSEPEETQTEKTTQIPSGSETENQPDSCTGPNREVDGEKGSKPERKEGPSGDSLPEKAPNEDDGPSGDSLPEKAPNKDDEETGTLSCQLSDAMPQRTDPRSDPGHDTKEKSESSSEPEETQTESPLNIQKPEEEETASDIYEEDVVRDENVQPQIIVQGNNKAVWTAAAVILLALVCALCQRSPDSTPPIPNEVDVVDVFNQEMKKLETTFPNQHPELWRRSLIHLRRHLKTKNPTEPVSLILTSGHRAEKTLGCLALCLARAFSTAHNSSVLNINGKNKASQDSDQVKLDIDSELRKAFEGKKSAAVIHRFEELPPGSTLIFYRYCDHENAAYKDVFLAFTVMLDAEVEVPSNVSLGRVEEMVQEHIKQKFVSSDKSATFNQMDVDKLGGLWSRISHLILPVAAEKKIEEQGCGDWDTSF